MSSGSSEGDRAAARAWCVVLRPPGSPAPADLLAALRRRAAGITECEDAHLAMAEVCRRAGRSDTPLVVTLVDPSAIPLATPLREALAAYAPATGVWVYDPAGTPRLRAARPGEALDHMPERRAPEVVVTPAARASATPKVPAPPLRLAGDATTEPKPPRATSAADLLTDEELSMLLPEIRKDGGRPR